MKLSTRDIAIIEDAMTQRETGAANSEIASAYGLQGKFAAQRLAAMFQGLSLIGVNVPKSTVPRGINAKEYAEFRAWKMQQTLRASESVLIPASEVRSRPAYQNGSTTVNVRGL